MKLTLILMLFCGTLCAQEKLTTHEDPATESLSFDAAKWASWSANDGVSYRTEVRFENCGDFIFYQGGKELLRLKRDKRGDPIYEALADFIAIVLARNDKIKGWRDLNQCEK